MKRIKRFDTQQEAEKDARAYDKARKFSGLDPLFVKQYPDGWWVINPGNKKREPA